MNVYLAINGTAQPVSLPALQDNTITESPVLTVFLIVQLALMALVVVSASQDFSKRPLIHVKHVCPTVILVPHLLSVHNVPILIIGMELLVPKPVLPGNGPRQPLELVSLVFLVVLLVPRGLLVIIVKMDIF